MPIQVDRSLVEKPTPDNGTTIVPRQHEQLSYRDDFSKLGNPSLSRFDTSVHRRTRILVSGQNLFYRIVIFNAGQTNVESLKSG